MLSPFVFTFSIISYLLVINLSTRDWPGVLPVSRCCWQMHHFQGSLPDWSNGTWSFYMPCGFPVQWFTSATLTRLTPWRSFWGTEVAFLPQGIIPPEAILTVEQISPSDTTVSLSRWICLLSKPYRIGFPNGEAFLLLEGQFSTVKYISLLPSKP